MDTHLRVTDQLGPHLKSLRKARGLSQWALGRLIGVGQTRITEIEANPGVVNLEQLMKVFRALDVELILRAEGLSTRPTSRDGSDDVSINLDDPQELRYWTKALGVTVDELRQAVQAAGHASAPAAESGLSGQWHISTNALRRALDRKLEKSKGTALHRDPHKGSW